MTRLEFERILNPLVNIIDDVEIELIYNILSRIDNYKDVKGSLKWYNDKVNELKLLERDNKRIFKDKQQKIKDVIEEIAKECGTKVDNFDKLENYYQQGLLNVNPITLYSSVAINNLINEAIKDGNDIMNLIQTKALESSKKEYMNILNQSYVETTSGAYTYRQSINKAIDRMAENGITLVHYKNGRTMTIEAVVRRDIVTRMNKLVGERELQCAKELGTNLVYVDQHLGARVRTPYMKNDYEAHCEWQGKKYLINGFNNKYDNLYEKTGYGEMLGLKGINCYHHIRPTWEWEKIDEKIDEIENKKVYELKQQQRAFERKIRKLKRKRESFRATKDKQFEKASQKYKVASEKFDKWLKENNLNRDYDREYIGKHQISSSDLNIPKQIEKLYSNQRTPNKKEQYILDKYINSDNILYTTDSKILMTYRQSNDKILINPNHQDIQYYDITKVLTHEVTHMIDNRCNYVKNNSTVMLKYMDNANKYIMENKEYYNKLFETDNIRNNMDISDLFSSITKAKIRGNYSHDETYWKRRYTRESELLANMTNIYNSEDKEIIEIVNSIPSLNKLYEKVISWYETNI